MTLALAEHFTPASLPMPEVLPVHPSPEILGYRAGAKLTLSRRGRTVQVGLYRRGSHRVEDVPFCPVHHPLVAAGVRALRSQLARAPQLLSPRVGAQGWLRYAAFQASVSEDRLFLSLVTASDKPDGVIRSLAARLAESVPQLCGVAWNVNPSSGNEIFGPQWEVVLGEGSIRERLGDLVFRASPSSFLQANRMQAGWVYRRTSAWLSPSAADNALDLYAGVGAVSLHLARGVARVVAIEGSAAAVADARWSASHNGIGNAEFLAGRVEDVLPKLLADGLRPQLVTLNPPRKGAAPAVLRALGDANPRAVLYISCNPPSLARDAAFLCESGRYRLDSVQPVDFFPQTEHVETVALFTPASRLRRAPEAAPPA